MLYQRILLVSALCAGTLFGQGKTVKRNFDEFLTAQGNWFWNWNDRDQRTLLVDYLGVYNRVYHLNLGTTVEGSVSERPQSDGTALVTVIVHTTDAIGYGWDGSKGAGLVFGYSVGEVLNQHKPASLGDALLKVEFTNPAMGAPLPVLIFLPADRLKGITFETTAQGSMRALWGVPDGTPGTAHTTQVGLYSNPHWSVGTDQFPVEKITFSAHGK